MRTSRVHGVPSSIFRNERQYLQSNELFHRVMSDGNGQTPNKGRQQQQQNNEKRTTQQSTQERRIRNNARRRARVDLPLDTETMLEMRSRMMQHSTEINHSINKKVRMHTYQTSI